MKLPRQYKPRKNRKLPKGVCQVDNRFIAIIWNRKKKKTCYVGSFRSMDAAHHAYNAAAARLHGKRSVVTPTR